MKKRYLIVLIVLLVVGFAAVTTILTINGTINLGANADQFAKDVIFTKAKIKGGNAVIENEGKSITFVSPTIRSLDEEAILNFTITNYNRQYDAEATIKCDFVKDDTLLGEEDFSEYIDVKMDATSYFIPASGNTPGQVISKLKKPYVGEDQEVKIECKLIVEAKSKDYLEDELVRPNSDNTIKYIPDNYSGEFWAYKTEITNIVFENELNPHIGDNIEEYNISESGTGTIIAYYDKDAKTVYIQGDGNIFANKDSSNLFKSFTKLETIDGLTLLDTSHVINMNSMFNNCGALKSLEGIGTWDTSNVTNMSTMFNDCPSLEDLEGIDSWNTSNVTNMSSMFNHCSSFESLEEIYLWDTSKVTDMSYMFAGCEKLISLDLTNWNTSKLRTVASMFSNCTSLTTLDINTWDTSQVMNMQSMFDGCSSLESVGDLSSWDTSKVTSMSYMFQNSPKINTTINITLNKLTYYNDMFKGAATEEEASIMVNYTDENKSLVNSMIARKSGDSKVSLGSVIPYYDITTNDDIIVTSNASKNYVNVKITLTTTSGKEIESFKMNGKIIKGSSFKMPNNEVTITDVVTK